MARLRFRGRKPQESTALLWLALGAVSGVAVALMLRRRGSRPARQHAGVDPETRLPDERPAAGSSRRGLERDAAEALVVLSPRGTGSSRGTESPRGTGARAPSTVVDESELEARVLNVFRNDPTLRGRAIDIGAIGEGTIELTGWVHSASELTYALTLARGVPDVADVMDSLAVRVDAMPRVGPTGAAR